MPKQTIISFFLVVMSSLFFAGAWNDAYWTDRNPHISNYLGVEVWDIAVMQPSLDSLGLWNVNASEISNGAVAAELQNARTGSNKAAYAKTQCEALGIALASPTGFDFRLSQAIALEILNGTFRECANYGEYWRSTMTYSERALLDSESGFRDGIAEARRGRDAAKQAGICDDDFTGTSKALCKEADFRMGALLATDYPAVSEYMVKYSEESMGEVPNCTGYADAMNIMWGRSENGISETKNLSAAALKKGNEDYNTIGAGADRVLGKSKQLLGGLENGKVMLITRSRSESGATGTVAERYSKLVSDAKLGDESYVKASLFYRWQYDGYLKNAIGELKNAARIYDAVAAGAEELTADADNVTAEQRGEAEAEILAFDGLVAGKPAGSEAKRLYESSKGMLRNGDAASKTGDKYAYYSMAAAEARKAQNSQRRTNAEMEAAVNAALKKSLEMLAGAKKDGIDVYTEEEELRLLNGIVADWAEGNLGGVQDSIAAKALLKYGYLGDKRAALLYRISLAGGRMDDLKAEMLATEAGAFRADGTLDAGAAVGRLAEIAKKYRYVESESEKDMKTIVTNSLKRDYGVETGEIWLDAPVNITVSIFLQNPTAFIANDILLSFPVWAELRENEIAEGAEFVDSATYSSGVLNLHVRKFGEYETQVIKFRKTQVLASVLKKDASVVGEADGSAGVDERTTFDAAYGLNGVWVPAEYDKWTIDGKRGRGPKTGPVTKGTHVLEGRYRVEDAFSTSAQGYRAVGAGLNSEVSYDLVITPKLDMDYATIIVSEENSGSTQDFSVTSYSGTSVRNKKSLGNGKYSFEAAGLQAGKNATVRVGYAVRGSVDYAKAEIALLKNGNRSAVTNSLLAAAEASLANNDTRRAVEGVEKAKKQIENEREAGLQEDAKLTRAKDKVINDREEVRNALSLAGDLGLTGPYVQKLEGRILVMERALVASDMAGISDYDTTWNRKEALGVRKDAFARYNALKEQYLGSGGNSGNESEFIRFEEAMGNLEASGSLEDAVLVLARLESVRSLADRRSRMFNEDYAIYSMEAASLRNETEGTIGEYAKEYDAVKGSAFAALFSYDYKNAQKELKALDNLLAKKAGPDVVAAKIADVKKLKKEMKSVLDYVRDESGNKLGRLKTLYWGKKATLSDNDRKLAEQGLLKMEEQIGHGGYAEALLTGEGVVAVISRSKEKDDTGLLIMALTALLIIGAIVIYLLNKHKGSGRQPRQLRKIRSYGEGE